MSEHVPPRDFRPYELAWSISALDGVHKMDAVGNSYVSYLVP